MSNRQTLFIKFEQKIEKTYKQTNIRQLGRNKHKNGKMYKQTNTFYKICYSIFRIQSLSSLLQVDYLRNRVLIRQEEGLLSFHLASTLLRKQFRQSRNQSRPSSPAKSEKNPKKISRKKESSGAVPIFSKIKITKILANLFQQKRFPGIE